MGDWPVNIIIFSEELDAGNFGEVCSGVWNGTPGMDNRQVLERVESGYRMPKPDACPDPLYDIMLSCWKHEPDDRPTFDYLTSTLQDFYVSASEGAYKENVQWEPSYTV